ncbi:MAG: M20/M25/M40 family metallo-hydrolase, partial [Candidatus Eisenbacteria bacterium]|nr:M20/M25/M40 family metallo-hydrolase [Candidatus Eisenbacteria bacterium]
MSPFALRSLELAVLVSLCLTIGIIVFAAPAGAAPSQEPTGRLVVLDWEQPDFGVLEPVHKEIDLLAHNRDLALLRMPLDLTLSAEFARRVVPLEGLPAGGELFLWQISAPRLATFEPPARVLFRHGRSVLVWSPDGPARLTAESRARLDGLVQPMRVTRDAKPWPAAAAFGAEGARARTDFHPLVDQIVSEIDLTEYVDVWQALDDFETRYTYTAQNEASADWMISVFESYGLQADYHYFNLDGQRKNVVATIPGMVDPDRVVYMTGHFDSISEDPYNSAPGADDNASGTAAFLEAARVLSQYPFHHTIKLVGFSGEEQGLYGSLAYVADIAAQGEDVIACFNLDMIAYAGNDPYPPDLIIYTNTQSLDVAHLLEDAVLEYVPQYVEPVVISDPIGASDHAAFWQYGYKAILGIEEEAWGSDFCPWYHTTQDRIEQYP